ncbi:helix-hairpin-helix domain-containing protein [Aeromicrobium sp. UC242_57]|uniref:helix-hairpin-helix domain-containing protein n=1 Tax=Aeromicrobium sp. UC242_57 TaxID=3374624 RepID=UPI0037B657C1
METVEQNAKQSLMRHKMKRTSDLTARSLALEEIQEALDLPTAPLRIECYDISNLGATETVASMVVFEDGLARKSEYRRFTIRNEDRAMSRRCTRSSPDGSASCSRPATRTTRRAPGIDPETGKPRRFAYKPALVVVDGGPPQVAAAHQAMQQLGITDIALVGLAKRLEEVWLPEDEDPVILPRTSEGLYLLQRLRDEAHRFAISHHRGRRSKSMIESVLDSVDGLGPTRRKAVLKSFGSIKKLRAATAEEIATVPGIGATTAQSIVDALATGDSAPAINTATGEIIES